MSQSRKRKKLRVMKKRLLNMHAEQERANKQGPGHWLAEERARKDRDAEVRRGH